MKVFYMIVENETGEILQVGVTDREAFLNMTSPWEGCRIEQVQNTDINKLGGENIDHEGDGKFMWRYCKEKKCLELKPDCEICPETGVPRKKKVRGKNDNDV